MTVRLAIHWTRRRRRTNRSGPRNSFVELRAIGGGGGLQAENCEGMTALASRSVVLVTGMSGTGKSTVLAELNRRGHPYTTALMLSSF